MSRLLGTLITLAMATPWSFGATFSVDGMGGGDFTDIQSAINAAAAGDTVLVKPGVYLIEEPLTPKGKPITVRSESGPESTIVRMAPGPIDFDRATVLSFTNGEVASSVMDGFTLTGGQGSSVGASPGEAGGGGVMVRAGSSPTLRNCTIQGNFGSVGGGVWCIEGASPSFIHCTIFQNHGGGVFSSDSSPAFTDCTISMNSTNLDDPDRAGGVGASRSSVVLIGCRIQGNSGDGVAIDCPDGTCTPSLTNCVLRDNQRDGLRSGYSRTTVVNCTLAGNLGYGLRSSGGPIAAAIPQLTSCILWNNAEGSIATAAGGVPSISYSCVERDTVWAGAGNINSDPRFCGFGGAQVYVHISPDQGSGTETDPFSSIVPALKAEFAMSLRGDSPCLGSGRNGVDRGAALGTCSISSATDLTIHLAEGSYVDGELKMPSRGRVNLQGAGIESTYINGTISGLREGSVVSSLTVSNGDGIVIGVGESAEIRDCSISSYAPGVTCQGFGSSASLTNCLLIHSTGPGVLSSGGASVAITSCTISQNSGGGASCAIGASVVMTNCIVWSNPGGPFLDDGSSAVTVTSSCIESTPIWAGPGNINDDPLFCGRASAPAVYVDPAHFGSGTGTHADPYASLELAFSGEFRFSLKSDSPCRGAGATGEDMGADLGACTDGGPGSLTVYLAPGTYPVMDLALPAIGEVSLVGDGSEFTVIDGTISGLRTGVLLAGLSVTGGDGLEVPEGAAPEIRDCRISGNSVGITARGRGASPAIINCLISRNLGSGVACTNGSSPNLIHCTITGNSKIGVACAGNAAPTLTSCIVWRNHGGSLAVDDSSAITARFSDIDSVPVWAGEGNIDKDPGFCGFASAPDVYVDGSGIGPGSGTRNDPYLRLEVALSPGYRFSLKPDSPCRGAGASGEDMGADLGTCPDGGAGELSVHVAPGTYPEGDLLLPPDGGVSLLGAGPEETIIEGTIRGLRTDILVSGLSVIHGFGFYVTEGSPEIRDSTLTMNAAGLACQGSGVSPKLVNCALRGNWGVGVSCRGHSSAVLLDCTITENSQGGVSCSDSSAELSRCVILGNSALSGGGLLSTGTSSPILTNCVIAGNLALNSGGGVFCADSASATLANCTIAQNKALLGGGTIICASSHLPVLINCLSWGNTPDDFLCGVVLSSMFDQDPQFVRAGAFEFDLYRCQSWEGPCAPAFAALLPDYHLKVGSPALDAGSSAGAPADDLDGRNRPCGGAFDIGAYEDCTTNLVPFQRGDANADKLLDISDAGACLGYLFLGQPAELPCHRSADVDGNGMLEISDVVVLLEYLYLGGPTPAQPFPGCGFEISSTDQLTCDQFDACP